MVQNLKSSKGWKIRSSSSCPTLSHSNLIRGHFLVQPSRNNSHKYKQTYKLFISPHLNGRFHTCHSAPYFSKMTWDCEDDSVQVHAGPLSLLHTISLLKLCHNWLNWFPTLGHLGCLSLQTCSTWAVFILLMGQDIYRIKSYKWNFWVKSLFLSSWYPLASTEVVYIYPKPCQHCVLTNTLNFTIW